MTVTCISRCWWRLLRFGPSLVVRLGKRMTVQTAIFVLRKPKLTHHHRITSLRHASLPIRLPSVEEERSDDAVSEESKHSRLLVPRMAERVALKPPHPRTFTPTPFRTRLSLITLLQLKRRTGTMTLNSIVRLKIIRKQETCLCERARARPIGTR